MTAAETAKAYLEADFSVKIVEGVASSEEFLAIVGKLLPGMGAAFADDENKAVVYDTRGRDLSTF